MLSTHQYCILLYWLQTISPSYHNYLNANAVFRNNCISSQLVIFCKLYKSMLYIIRKLGKKNIQCFWKGAKLSAPNPQMSSLVENEKLKVLFEHNCLRNFLWISIFLLLRHFSSCLPPASRKFFMPYHRKRTPTWWVRFYLLMWGIIWVKQYSSGPVFLVCQRGHFTRLCQEFYYRQDKTVLPLSTGSKN